MFRTAFLAALCCVVFSFSAEARQRHHVVVADPGCNILWPCAGVVTSPRGEKVVRAMGGFGVAQKVYQPRKSLSVRNSSNVNEVRGRLNFQPSSASVVAHPAGCPRTAFCGCGAAIRVFGHSVRDLWLAANWFKFPRAAPAPGMAAVKRHHVFVLEQHIGGDTWLAYDANSGGHATRIHARSIAGYTIVDPHA